MSPRYALPVLVAMLLALPPAAAAPGMTGLVEPGLQGAVLYEAGDFWKFERVPAPGATPPTGGTSEIYVRELGAVKFNLSGEEVIRQSWRMRWYVNLSTYTGGAAENLPSTIITKMRQDRWYLHGSDPDFPLAEARADSKWDANVEGYASVRSLSEYRPPLLHLIFPFAAEDEWITISTRHNTDYEHCMGESPCQSTTPLQYHYTVLREDEVRIEHQASKFANREYAAWVVKKDWINAAGNERYELLWWVPSLCNHAKRQEYIDDGRGGGLKLQFTEWLTDAKCKASVPEDQPAYNLEDPKNFSSTRFHGELTWPDLSWKNAGKEGSDGGGGGGGGSLIHKAVPVSPVVALGALLLAAFSTRRRAES